MRFKLVALLLCCTSLLQAQVLEQTDKLERINLEVDDNSAEIYSEHLENIDQFLNHPINLSSATTTELKNTGLFNAEQIDAIIAHIEFTGKIIDLYELQIIPVFSTEDLLNLAKYCIHLTETNYQIPSTTATTRIKFNNQVNLFQGSSFSLYHKLSHKNTSGISWMIATEQDIGEQYHFNSIQFPLDHLCGSIYFTKNNLNVIAGSFRSFLGQGLLSGQGKGTEFAADWTTLIATNNGFIPYASAMESGYQNGIAIRKDNKKWSFFLAQSYQKVDSGSSSGLHRTASEIGRKDQISQAIFNGRLAYHFKSSQIGINTLVEEFKNKKGISLDFLSHYQNMLIGSEIAVFNDKIAFHLACMAILNKQSSIAFGLNYFTKNYQNEFASNQLLQGNAKNDLGFSIAFKQAINSKSYFQIVSNTHLINGAENTIKVPSIENKIQGVLIYINRIGNEIQLKSSYQIKNNNKIEIAETIRKYEYLNTFSATIVFKKIIAKQLYLLHRFDYKTNSITNSNAFQCAIKYTLSDLKLTIGYGITFYKCEFDTRIYSAEQQLPNYLTSVLLNGNGTRAFFYFQSKIRKNCTLSLKSSKNKVLGNNNMLDYAIQVAIKL
jgi:hypothetical protein